MTRIYIILTSILLNIILMNACNENICGRIVTKCMLIQACTCSLKDCVCCRDCFICLDVLFDECCSCMNLCPTSDNSWANLSKTSYVEDMDEKMPQLFDALTALPDPIDRWTVFTFPVEIDTSFFASKIDTPMKMQTTSIAPTNLEPYPNLDTVNCTVAYIAGCTSLDKCKNSCKSMGATSIRWFHDGCCECIGDTCLNYGINESRCLNCNSDTMNDEQNQINNDVLDDGDYDDELEEYDDYGDDAT